MRHRGRAVALGAVCAGALWLAAAPASALTLTVGGPTVGASLSVGNGPAQVGVQAPDAASINVQADPTTGVQTSVQTPLTPPIDVAVATPPLSALAPITSSPPVAAPAPAPAAPTVPAPAPGTSPASPSPIASHPIVSTQPENRAPAPVAARAGQETGIATATRPINAIRHDARGTHSNNVTASIASGSDSGILSALESNDARLLLWLALAGFVIAMRMFVGSATSRHARAS
jgi:hypothetical protein